MSWVSPTSYDDPDGAWTDPELCYDNDTVTHAMSYKSILPLSWGSFLILNAPEPISCDKIRFNCQSWDGRVDLIDVDVLVDGVWVDVYEGSYPNHAFDTKTFPAGLVTAMRLRFYNSNPTYGYATRIYEVHFGTPIEPPPTHALSITSTVGGTTDPPPAIYDVDVGALISVTAIPDSGYIFSNWKINGETQTANPINVTMDADKSLNAVFTPETPTEYTLTIEAGAGGTTKPIPGTRTFPAGTKVSLDAVPSLGYVFDHWELDGVPWGTNVCKSQYLTMNADHHLLAVFAVYPLPANEFPCLAQTGYLGTCKTSYSEMRDTPSGIVYDHRSDPGSCPGAMCLIMAQHTSDIWYCGDKTFIFVDTSAIPIGATVSRVVLKAKIQAFDVRPIEGVGGYNHFDVVVQQSIDPEYPHIPLIPEDWDRTKYQGDYGRKSTDKMPLGATVHIEVDPSVINKGGITKLVLRHSREIVGNYVPFGGLIYFFSPNSIGVANHPSLYVDFEAPLQWTLNITSTEGGTTDPVPDTYTYDEGTVATVTAIPQVGYVFDHWVLDGFERAENPITILMNKDYMLTAHFTEEAPPPPPTYKLTISSTIGGTTEPSPNIYEYEAGVTATVTAIADATHHFNHWELDGATKTENPINVTMNKDQTLLAIFTVTPPPPPPPFPGWVWVPIIIGAVLVGYILQKNKR